MKLFVKFNKNEPKFRNRVFYFSKCGKFFHIVFDTIHKTLSIQRHAEEMVIKKTLQIVTIGGLSRNLRVRSAGMLMEIIFLTYIIIQFNHTKLITVKRPLRKGGEQKRNFLRSI
jgi:hypothetical protein